MKIMRLLASAAVLAFVASPAFASNITKCEERVTDGGQTITDVFGPKAFGTGVGGKSGVVFYGDVGCGPAGTCVMPSLSTPQDGGSVVKTVKIGENVVDNPDIIDHRQVIENPLYPHIGGQYIYTGPYSSGGC